MVPFAGYDMPVQYTSVLEETKAVRRDAGLFDVSHMGQFSIKGKRALDEVQRLVSNDLTKIAIGQAQYNMLCNEEGGVIDDLVIYRRSEAEIYICVNASNRAKDLAWMLAHLGKDVTLEDQSDVTALIAIQGPKAEEILAIAGGGDSLSSLKYYWAVDAKVFGKPCYLSRTGYTGEDGFELYVRTEDGATIWEELLEKGRRLGLVPAGLGARDTLRLEMGYPLHGHELSPTISPLSAGLGWVVKLSRGTPFIGQEALKKEAERGPDRLLKAFVINDRRIARQGYRITDATKEVIGEITSGTMSPHRNTPVALGFVRKEVATQTQFLIEIREAHVPAQTVKLPFVASHTRKT